ncbi:MAG: hypothetical protein EAZ55_01040 [Cytophagales bacterium]|nr:MAG: hypothetical protein EAZ55_01040 [Cytophagales bacterium]
MKKPKKITVKFFLHTILKPLDETKPEEEREYALYTRITYNRKNTDIKVHYGGYFRTLEEVRTLQPHLLPFEEQTFRKVVLHEVSKQGEDIDMKGLGDKYARYCLSIHALFSNHLKARLRSESAHARPKEFGEVIDFKKESLEFKLIFRAAKKLFENLEEVLSEEFWEEMRIYEAYYELYKKEVTQKTLYQFPIVVDWLNGTHLMELEPRLLAYFEAEPFMVSRAINTINRIVWARTEKIK